MFYFLVSKLFFLPSTVPGFHINVDVVDLRYFFLLSVGFVNRRKDTYSVFSEPVDPNEVSF